MKYLIKVNGVFEFNAESKSGGRKGIEIVNSPLNPDIIQTSERFFHILQDGKSFEGEVIDVNPEARTYTIRVNRNTYTVNLTSSQDSLLSKMGLDALSVPLVHSLKAPMPGLVLRLSVNEGEVMKKGEALLVLEAMKMENSIRASETVKVKKILVRAGDKVEKNQVLMLFDPA